jgi:hypothetical protein
MFQIEFLIRSRQEELLKEAARYQLINQAQQRSARQKYSLRPVLTWLGGFLCKWGNLLQERFGDVGMVTPCQAEESKI